MICVSETCICAQTSCWQRKCFLIVHNCFIIPPDGHNSLLMINHKNRKDSIEIIRQSKNCTRVWFMGKAQKENQWGFIFSKKIKEKKETSQFFPKLEENSFKQDEQRLIYCMEIKKSLILSPTSKQMTSRCIIWDIKSYNHKKKKKKLYLNIMKHPLK